MNEILDKYKTLLTDISGVEAIKVEMARQQDDAVTTYKTQRAVINQLAEAIRSNPNVLLLGMGASHFVNEIFALQVRSAGIQAIAMTASEFLYDPIRTTDKIVILTSQSGESVETIKCLSALSDTTVYGVTLTPESTIARETKAIICAGGSEIAFAGTRSVTLSLAAFAFVAEALGIGSFDAITKNIQFKQENLLEFEKAVWTLFSKRSIIATGRSLFAPLAQLFALGCEELSTKPVLCNESGMFRHGPMEVLDSDTALVIFRQSGELGELCRSFNQIQKKTGCTLVVIDSSGLEPLENAITIPCPQGSDIVAVLGAMTTFQTLMIAYACGKNPRTGLPKYGSKVTTTE